MYQKWFIPLEESGCFLDASSCIEQLFPFVTDVDGQPEMLVGLQESDYLFSEVVDVDDDFGESRSFQFQDDVFQHRLPGNGNQGFWQVVGEGFQPGTKSGGKNHGFHLASKICSIFCSRWMSCTFTPNFRLMCSATCWAE